MICSKMYLILLINQNSNYYTSVHSFEHLGPDFRIITVFHENILESRDFGWVHWNFTLLLSERPILDRGLMEFDLIWFSYRRWNTFGCCLTQTYILQVFSCYIIVLTLKPYLLCYKEGDDLPQFYNLVLYNP